MSETPRPPGGETAPKPEKDLKSIIGLSTAELDEVLSRRRSIDAYIGRTDSDHSDFDEKKAEVVDDVNRLLELLGVQGEAWRTAFVGYVDRGYNRVDPVGHPTAGAFVYEAAFMDLDIETYDHGFGGARLAFNLPNDRHIIVSASGDFWTERWYKHPRTGERLYIDEDERLRMEELLDQEMELLDSGVDFVLSFEVRIENGQVVRGEDAG